MVLFVLVFIPAKIPLCNNIFKTHQCMRKLFTPFLVTAWSSISKNACVLEGASALGSAGDM